MSERPILFSGPMVRALLDGSKTQTRRVIAQQPSDGWAFEVPPFFGRISSPHPKKGRFGVFVRRGIGTDFPEIDLIPCPYGMPGDSLWVRETWNHAPAAIGATRDEDGPFAYAAGYATESTIDGKWRPSIHMPRYASRITLEVTSVRVERLHDITDADALAEGVDRTNTSIPGYARERFVRLWTSINGNESWASDPWVWVVEFKKL
ncbi:Phage-related protein [Caballeronia glathei]|uniref:Uncharacterized protein n=1 Tax=Caballeronia glathei TaxID=60547 RepID=A0A069PMC4_9BURK|nr:hypothetical protein [Caballeronia glathei]KDR41572.1 hypothetical protein BG61_17030 [Caballeronia glathei]CDY79422.1 Phage-related protein [Caballeronia glathei]